MGSTPKPPRPDPALGQAALEQARIAREMATLSREQMGTQRQQDARNYQLAQQQFDYQRGILDQQMGWAAQDRSRMEQTYRPLEDQVIRDAQGWDRPENMARRTGAALSDVQQAVGQQNKAVAQQMLNMGVNPMSGRFVGALRAQAGQNAALQAQAVNQTRGQLMNEAQQMRFNAAQMGNPLLAASYGGIQSSGGMAGQLMNPFLQANQQAIGGWQAGMQGMGMGSDANAQSFNMQNQMYQNTLNAWNMKQQQKAARTGAVLGLVGGALAGPLGAGLGAMAGGGTFAGGIINSGDKGFLGQMFSPAMVQPRQP